MRWAGHTAGIGEREVYTALWWENLRDRADLEDLGLGESIMLKWIFRQWDVGAWIGSIWLRTGTNGGHL
jgi:hypothetical protein